MATGSFRAAGDTVKVSPTRIRRSRRGSINIVLSLGFPSPLPASPSASDWRDTDHAKIDRLRGGMPLDSFRDVLGTPVFVSSLHDSAGSRNRSSRDLTTGCRPSPTFQIGADRILPADVPRLRRESH